jgi:hypothetical protein
MRRFIGLLVPQYDQLITVDIMVWSNNILEVLPELWMVGWKSPQKIANKIR